MQSKILTSFLMAGVLITGGLASRAEQTNAPAATPPGANSAPPQQTLQPRMRPLPGASMGGPMAVLTEEQRASYQKNIPSSEMMELYSKRQAARLEIGQMMYAPKVDENLIRQRIMEEAKIEADIAILQAKAFAEVQPPLTDEQIDKVKQMLAPRQPMIRPTPPPTTPSTTVTNQGQSGLPGKQ
jgi:hypothetical protein